MDLWGAHIIRLIAQNFKKLRGHSKQTIDILSPNLQTIKNPLNFYFYPNPTQQNVMLSFKSNRGKR